MLCLCIREPLHVRGPAGKGQAGDFLHHRAQRRKCERGVDRPARPCQINRQILKACAWTPYRRDVNKEKEWRVHARRIWPSFDDHRRAGDGVYANASFSASLALHFSSTIPKHRVGADTGRSQQIFREINLNRRHISFPFMASKTSGYIQKGIHPPADRAASPFQFQTRSLRA
jgi:hypothetical protein